MYHYQLCEYNNTSYSDLAPKIKLQNILIYYSTQLTLLIKSLRGRGGLLPGEGQN